MSSDSSSVLSLSHTQDQTQSTEKNTKNEWDFLNSSLRKVTEDTNQSIYVHPLSKFSSSSLSPRSLEICTECLGSETGSGIDSNADEIDYYQTKSSRKTRESISKKAKPIASFPPPLTSISGIEGVQVQTHREGGRLVIKAFNYTSCGTFLRAERENGRLRLSYFRDNRAIESDCELDVTEEDEDENNASDDNERDCDEKSEIEGGFGALFWGENGEEESGILGWSSPNIIRCNGDSNGGDKRIPSLPFCVAIS